MCLLSVSTVPRAVSGTLQVLNKCLLNKKYISIWFGFGLLHLFANSFNLCMIEKLFFDWLPLKSSMPFKESIKYRFWHLQPIILNSTHSVYLGIFISTSKTFTKLNRACFILSVLLRHNVHV